jgi:hypothetical protein
MSPAIFWCVLLDLLLDGGGPCGMHHYYRPQLLVKFSLSIVDRTMLLRFFSQPINRLCV